MAFDLDPSYKQVPERIADFKAKHPEGTLQPADPMNPYRIETIGDKTYIVYTAAAYRTPDDQRPGIGIAWEQFPGKTPYTRDSELQNAETSAWGRAIVAALASESKSVASAEDVRNRAAESAPAPPPPANAKRYDCPESECPAGNMTAPEIATHVREAHGYEKGEDGKMHPPAPVDAPSAPATGQRTIGAVRAGKDAAADQGDETAPPLTADDMTILRESLSGMIGRLQGAGARAWSTWAKANKVPMAVAEMTEEQLADASAFVAPLLQTSAA